MIRKTCVLFLALVLGAALAGAEGSENFLAELDALTEGDTISYETRTMTCYIGNLDSYVDVTLCFFSGEEQIPFIEAEEMADLYVTLCRAFGEESAGLYVSGEDGIARFTRENGYEMSANYLTGEVSFIDYDAFLQEPGGHALLDTVGETGFDSEGLPALFERVNAQSYDRYGSAVTLNLSGYHIPTVAMDAGWYMPLQTFGDILVSRKFGMGFLYNGTDLFLANGRQIRNGNELTPLGSLYYKAEPRKRSAAAAQFNYAELCFALDLHYGLKESHDIRDFDTVFDDVGFRELLLDPDPVVSDCALYNFIELYLDDLHSTFRCFSWAGGAEPDLEDQELYDGLMSNISARNMELYEAARSARYPDGCPVYEEVGNTAYVTFDSFEINNYDYYGETEHDPDADTIEMVIYAHRQITREGSPIKNVVLDLSNNDGGTVDAAAYLLCWFLGESSISMKDMYTRAVSTATYHADVNLDRVFDERDTVTDKNLFCLISPNSFSCGNLLPAAFKADQSVTLVGRTSGGGSCVVQQLTTAGGAAFQVSGMQRLSIMKNGSFYDIDAGMDPDVYLRRIDTFYDREALTELLCGLR